MPKVDWAEDVEDAITADDIESAEDGYTQYAGDIPQGGLYRFRLGRMKFREANTGTKGLSIRLSLDGSWKPAHRKYEGCPLWDNVWMTRGSAPFVKAFAAALGVSAADIVNKVVMDEDDVITKIGRKVIKEDEILVYVAVKRGEWPEGSGNWRLEKAGTGFQVVEADDADEEDEEDEESKPAPKKSAAKAAPAKAGKAKAKSRAEDEEAPF
jgi:hypothetical protein